MKRAFWVLEADEVRALRGGPVTLALLGWQRAGTKRHPVGLAEPRAIVEPEFPPGLVDRDLGFGESARVQSRATNQGNEKGSKRQKLHAG